MYTPMFMDFFGHECNMYVQVSPSVHVYLFNLKEGGP